MHVLEKSIAFSLMSDGFFEYEREGGEQFGQEKVVECLLASREQSSQEMVETLVKEVETFADGAPQPDDMTIIVIKRTAS